MSIRKFASSLMAATLSFVGTIAFGETDQGEKQWQVNYDARQKHFEKTVGPLPSDILKMLNMTGVWPGGGLYVIPAPRLGQNLSVYTTFGFTNPDMPTTVQMANFDLKADGDRATKAGGTLTKKQPAPKRPGFAGYGYEIIVVAQSNQQWPLNLLQWAANAEIGNDVGLLGRVEKYDGLTVEQIQVGQGQMVNVLIAKAQAPLPTGTSLPAGRMEILVATTITAQEMKWSQSNGRAALLKKLQESGVGQVSVPDRQTVVQ
ncbi:Suppressor of fused protein (SUFU) [Dechloromonas denitrificans]|uniref:Suppressor of fused protein (SUFU) n=1 Tax=Dechloromonas denitrificans TaxID=281362 RepID=A0A133XNA8_9RHOO|nr:suppressor of fused domain protein [Dechloromonas denitrificans]KXB32423.1 Suppressor of fused protein (SUFU) [Dechloromonas denitrificans]